MHASVPPVDLITPSALPAAPPLKGLRGRAMPEPAASRGPYRPATKRAPNPGPLELQERDLDVLAAILDHRFLTAELLLQLFPPDLARTPTIAIAAALQKRSGTFSGKHVGSNLERRLRQLYHHGYVDRIARGLERRRDERPRPLPLAYALTSAGRALLKRAGHLPRKGGVIGPAEHLFYVHHALMVARFRIALELAVRERPSLELVDSQRESEALRHSWTERGERFSVNPDGFFLLVDRSAPEGRNARAAFIECDRGTMAPEALLLKYETYARSERAGQLEHALGISSVRVLTIAVDDTRAAKLLTLAAETESPVLDGYRDRFLFTSEHAYREAPTNVLAQIWRSADKPSERNAVIPSPLGMR